LQAGGTISRQGVNFSIPASIAAGTYRLFLVTDATNNIIESTEGNNASTGVPITIAAPASGVGIPDLRVTTVSAPQVANSGESIVINWHVTNGGTSAAAGPWWSDAVWLSRDGVLDATDTFVGSYPRTMPLAPGESYRRDATVRLGIDLSGDHVVIVRTDHRNLIFEGTGEGNNTTVSSPATSIALTPTPDLRIEQVTSPANATAGGEVTIAWQVLNGGVGEARTSWHDAVYLSPTPTFDRPRSVLLGFVASNTTSLAAGGRYTRSENLTIPHHV
jgi:subtilase family serine protease